MKYRIKKTGKYYYPQYKSSWLYDWSYFRYFLKPTIRFTTFEEAMDYIENYSREHSTDGIVWESK